MMPPWITFIIVLIVPLFFIPAFLNTWRLLHRFAPSCPECRTPIGLLQSPLSRSRRQWAEGGYFCRDCGCETDLAGMKVPRGLAPCWRWIAFAFGLPAILFGLAIFLMISIFQISSR